MLEKLFLAAFLAALLGPLGWGLVELAGWPPEVVLVGLFLVWLAVVRNA